MRALFCAGMSFIAGFAAAAATLPELALPPSEFTAHAHKDARVHTCKFAVHLHGANIKVQQTSGTQFFLLQIKVYANRYSTLQICTCRRAP